MLILLFWSPAMHVSARFYYPNFLDVTALKMRGSAQKHGHCLSLTREPKEVGAFWYKRPVQVDNGFFTAFNIKINPLIQSQKGGRTGGEGMAFVLHRSPARFSAIGLSGPSLGYGGLKDALVIEFDSRQNKENEDPNGNHVSLHLPRDIPGNKEPISNAFEYDISLSRTDVPVLVSGKMFTVQVSYDGEVIKIFLNDLVNPILKYKVALSGECWLGFTASTGHTEETTSKHRVCDWYFETKNNQDHCDNGFLGAACALDAGPAVTECLSETTCYSCLNHIRDCRWCSSQKRCVAGAVSSDEVADLKTSYCEDPTSLLTDERECSMAEHTFMSMWNSFLALMIALLFFSMFGRVTTVSSSPSSQYLGGGGGQRKCFRNSAKMNHLFELLEATCAGAIFAVVVSYSVNYSLFLLTTYTLYSMGLGLLFMVIGGLILWQTLTQHFEGGNPYGELLDTSTTSFSHCVLLCCFSIFLATCGVLCFMLEGDFAVHMSPMTRVMVYAAVGIALCFSFVFVAVDLATRSANICRTYKLKPLAEHPRYIRLLAGSACISGIYFGYVFGTLDVANLNKSHVQLAIQQQNYYCYPLGSLLGGLTAFANKFMSLPVLSSKQSFHMQDGL